ncbi:hypothetical protein CIG1485E_1242 [Campylobacter iguaniorum]|uniref:Uncharacterized protein n=1 Tax=Campylobacter iguaniorum TaxID=1244531 RepID=A0A076FAS9_9BACT|nr:hypothetical protein [Campylobacter iguaniorum]AII15076.1 hypothetical protein CIG1485E_1242 [Campylobacter iguaniorum]
MHWLDKEIVVVEIGGRFFALNGWDGECYSRCWECGDRVGDKFHKVIGVDTFSITQTQNGDFELSKNQMLGTIGDLKADMYKSLLPYMGMANTVSGEVLRAICFIEQSITTNKNITGAIKFLKQNIDDDGCQIYLDEIKSNDFSNLATLKQKIESIVLAQYERNDLEINFEDFEDMDE